VLVKPGFAKILIDFDVEGKGHFLALLDDFEIFTDL
jgi:hypothetical protein